MKCNSIEFERQHVSIFIQVADHHIHYYGHVSKWDYGETEIYYRLKCPLCHDWDKYYDPYISREYCPLCNDDERVNIFRWLWIRLQLSRVNDWRQQAIHWFQNIGKPDEWWSLHD